LTVLIFELAHLDGCGRTDRLLFVRLVPDIAGHNFSVELNSNDQGAAIIAEQRFQIRLLIFGMILFGKNEFNGFLTLNGVPLRAETNANLAG
jgi:hypothetical protein